MMHLKRELKDYEYLDRQVFEGLQMHLKRELKDPISNNHP